jgi:hypothetical protein
VRLPQRQTPAATQLGLGALRQPVGQCRHQDLSRPRERHQPCGDRLRQSLDFDWLRAARDFLGRVVPTHDFADMDADARGHRRRFELGQLAQPALVLERERDRLHRTFEQQQEAVGLVDLLAAMLSDQVARKAVVAPRQLRRALVPEAIHQRRAVGQIEHQHSPQGRLARRRG